MSEYGFESDNDFDIRFTSPKAGVEYECQIIGVQKKNLGFGPVIQFELEINPVDDSNLRFNHNPYIGFNPQRNSMFGRFTAALLGEKRLEDSLQNGISKADFLGATFRAEFLEKTTKNGNLTYPIHKVISEYGEAVIKAE